MVEKEEKKEWKSAEVVFGRLTKIDKEDEKITIEIREYNDESGEYEWTAHWYPVAEGFNYENALELLDKDVKLRIIDKEAVYITR